MYFNKDILPIEFKFIDFMINLIPACTNQFERYFSHFMPENKFGNYFSNENEIECKRYILYCFTSIDDLHVNVYLKPIDLFYKIKETIYI